MLARRLFLAGAASLPFAGAAAAAPRGDAFIYWVLVEGRVITPDNPALRVANSLCNATGADFWTGIDSQTFAAAARICDEQIVCADGGVEPRYRIQGELPAFGSPMEELVAYLGAMRGRATFDGERWFIAAGVA